MPHEPRRLLHALSGAIHEDLRHAARACTEAAKLGVVRKHRPAGQHALLRRDPDLTFEGRMYDKARRSGRSQGHRRRAGSSPSQGDKMTSFPAASARSAARTSRPVSGRTRSGAVILLAHELPVIPTVVDHDMRKSERGKAPRQRRAERVARDPPCSRVRHGAGQ